MVQNKSAIVVGAGILGLATARALCLKGYSVTVIDKSEKAVGASVRNFGMLWPVGQPDGILYNRALRSKTIWKDIADSIGLWYDEVGSLHVAYHQDEWTVLQELYSGFSAGGRPVQLLDSHEIMQRFKGVKSNGLLGGLYSATETIIDPREAMTAIPAYLHEYLDVQFIWGQAVTQVATGMVWMGSKTLQADIICICSGADFETLYPEVYLKLPITKCKLQMMRFISKTPDFKMGVSLCGGLSLIHYGSFKIAPSLPRLKARYEAEMSEYLKWGIHVMVSQNDKLELTVGDSHEYGLTFDPFDKVFINEMVLKYLKQFAVTDDWEMTASWHGIYPKMTNGATEVFLQPDEGVYILNGIGGAGMTLSFGYAEEVIGSL
ncbi:MAG: TIGR03364 family FAD-dependent oxidoreductase [Ferruginibacter sp.]|nr:TIGR03364 family FAD-dependent oxidoreductase [Ferruginibacter sp.]